MTCQGDIADGLAVLAANILTLVAFVLLVAAAVATIRDGTTRRLARRTWILVAVIFLVVSTWLRFMALD